jgi:hypothetical protein
MRPDSGTSAGFTEAHVKGRPMISVKAAMETDLKHPTNKTTRKLLSSIASTLRVADSIAIMMVFVTALSAYATWKTAHWTNEILLTSQRPYIGVESISLINAPSPTVVADLRNFGSVQAEHTLISIVLTVDGKALAFASDPQQQVPVVLSPAVPHRFCRHISANTYREVGEGKAELVVEIQVRYLGPRGDEHCYLTRKRYDPLDDYFYSLNGSISCNGARTSL